MYDMIESDMFFLRCDICVMIKCHIREHNIICWIWTINSMVTDLKPTKTCRYLRQEVAQLRRQNAELQNQAELMPGLGTTVRNDMRKWCLWLSYIDIQVYNMLYIYICILNVRISIYDIHLYKYTMFVLSSVMRYSVCTKYDMQYDMPWYI